MNKLSKTIIALTTLFVIGFLALEGCNKKEAKQPKVSGFFVSGCNDIVLHRDNELNDTIYVTAVDDTKLKISTTNTPFSCGVDTIRPEIQTQEQNISIELLYEDSWADCLCGRHRLLVRSPFGHHHRKPEVGTNLLRQHQEGRARLFPVRGHFWA